MFDLILQLVDMSVAWLGNRMVAFSEVCSIARLFG
jgi:hypothetical protein